MKYQQQHHSTWNDDNNDYENEQGEVCVNHGTSSQQQQQSQQQQRRKQSHAALEAFDESSSCFTEVFGKNTYVSHKKLTRPYVSQPQPHSIQKSLAKKSKQHPIHISHTSSSFLSAVRRPTASSLSSTTTKISSASSSSASSQYNHNLMTHNDNTITRTSITTSTKNHKKSIQLQSYDDSPALESDQYPYENHQEINNNNYEGGEEDIEDDEEEGEEIEETLLQRKQQAKRNIDFDENCNSSNVFLNHRLNNLHNMIDNNNNNINNQGNSSLVLDSSNFMHCYSQLEEGMNSISNAQKPVNPRQPIQQKINHANYFNNNARCYQENNENFNNNNDSENISYSNENVPYLKQIQSFGIGFTRQNHQSHLQHTVSQAQSQLPAELPRGLLRDITETANECELQESSAVESSEEVEALLFNPIDDVHFMENVDEDINDLIYEDSMSFYNNNNNNNRSCNKDSVSKICSSSALGAIAPAPRSNAMEQQLACLEDELAAFGVAEEGRVFEFDWEDRAILQERESSAYAIDADALLNYRSSFTNFPKKRAILFDWMQEVSSSLCFKRETYQQSICIVDRYFSEVPSIQKSKLQLVGATALLIAHKIEEVIFWKIADFIMACNFGYTHEQFLEMEKEICLTLKFQLSPPTVYFWMNEMMVQWDQFCEEFEQLFENDVIYFKKNTADSFKLFASVCQYLDCAFMDIKVHCFSTKSLIACFMYWTLYKSIDVQQHAMRLSFLNQIFDKFLATVLDLPTLDDLLPQRQFTYPYTVLTINLAAPQLRKELADQLSNSCSTSTSNSSARAQSDSNTSQSSSSAEKSLSKSPHSNELSFQTQPPAFSVTEYSSYENICSQQVYNSDCKRIFGL